MAISGHTFNEADSTYASLVRKVEAKECYTVADISDAVADSKVLCTVRDRQFFKDWKSF